MNSGIRNIQGMLLDVEAEHMGMQTVLHVYVSTEQGIERFTEAKFEPYFYISCQDKELKPKELARRLLEERFSGGTRISKSEVVHKKEGPLIKLYFRNVPELKIVRDEVKRFDFVRQRYEHTIPFARRYIIDNGLKPMQGIHVHANADQTIHSISPAASQQPVPEPRMGALDLEMFSPGKMASPEHNPIIMASLAVPRNAWVWCTRKELEQVDFVKVVEDEAKIIEGLAHAIRAHKLDIVATYNGDRFDLPYIKKRAEVLGTAFDVGFGKVKVQKRQLHASARIPGVQHLDCYQMLLLLNRLQVVNLIKFDLESVTASLFNEKKFKFRFNEINQTWETGKGLADLARYNQDDSMVTLRVAEKYLDLVIALCRLTRQTLFEVSRSSAGQLVEALLMNEAFAQGHVIPSTPSEETVKSRQMNPITAAYVKEPLPGLHENIAVIDFRSMYPTIMISHNISGDTLDCAHSECKTGKNLAPTNHWFCAKETGFMSSILDRILTERLEAKDSAKKAVKGSGEQKELEAKAQGLKILLNSFYGTLAYPRFRWYSRDAAQATTAFARHYIKQTIAWAEEAGFHVLYSDTDSLFLLANKQKKEDVELFVESVNKKLPGRMELEFKGVYARGIFVTKKNQGERGAKKKYALMDAQKNLTIVGFEYVRRDWCALAKKTQKGVLEHVLSEGAPEKAIRLVRQTIDDLKKGRIPVKDLAILKQIRRPLRKYAAIGPHVAAAKKAVARGKEMGTGSVVAYVITKKGTTISEKAELEEFVGEGNYDAEYYIQHQIVPAVIYILAEFGLSETDLMHGGKQSSLGAFA